MRAFGSLCRWSGSGAAASADVTLELSDADFVAMSTGKADAGAAIPHGPGDDYTRYLAAGSIGDYAKQYSITGVPFVRKLIENPAYTEFWSLQAVDKWMAGRPLTVPTMLEVGQWDQEDSYGAPAVYRALERLGFAEANVGKITDIIACPGLDYCALANARSIPVAQRISNHFAGLARQHDIGDLKIKISGCINACGHHHVGHIGILGVDKNGVELYQISLGGDVDFGNTAIGAILGPAVPADRIVEAVDSLVNTYLDQRGDGERFVDTYRRIGAQPFKESVYGQTA